jgi:putative nucleotidyltransferase with HDIG domain
MSARVGAYIFAISVAAVTVCAWLWSTSPGVGPDQLRAAAVFAALATFAHILRYQTTRGAVGSIAFIPHLAVIALLPNWTAVASVVFSIAVAELTAWRSAPKAIFNIAQHALASALAVLAYQFAGGTSLLVDPRFYVGPFSALLIVFVLTNSFAVSVVIALSEDRNVWQLWKEGTFRTLAYDVLSLPVVFAFVWVYVNGGPTGVALLAVPVLGVRQLYISNWQLERTNQELLELMVAAIEARDPYTSGHSRRVAHYSKIIARAVGLGRKEVERVGVAALLHDVGKIHEVFAPILRKPDQLSAEEWDIMKTHPIKSAELAQHVSQLKDVVPALRHHHENWDGTGYPDGLAGELIPMYARVIMFADTIDAMTTDRPYRAALDESAVRAELVRMRGRQFDPRICDTLLSSSYFAQIFERRPSRATPRAIAGDLSSQRIRLRA